MAESAAWADTKSPNYAQLCRQGVAAQCKVVQDYAADSIGFYLQNPNTLKNEVLSGFMVSILQVPESVAFSYVAGVHPMQGLYGSFFMCITTAILGGRPGMISGCAGALAVVINQVMMDSGPFGDKCPDERREYLFFVMVLTGMLQIVCGALNCAKLVKLIPKTAFLGFFNGLAVVIFVSQLETFCKIPEASVAQPGALLNTTIGACRPTNYGFREVTEWYTLEELTTWLMIAEVFIVVLFIEGIPLLPQIPLGSCGKVKLDRVVPPSLVGLLFAMGFEWLCLRPSGLSTPVVKDTSSISSSGPEWHVPEVPWGSWETWSKSLPVAAALCVIGLVESVLTLQAVDQILEEQTPVWKKNQECLVQGLANLLSGFFKAMGGDAMIGQSTINVMNGAQGRLSALCAALFLLLHICAFGAFIEAVPTAALAGILFVVVIHTFNWDSVAIIARRALPLYMCATIVIVTLLSALTNLAIGIGAGIVWESIFFIWRAGAKLEVVPFEKDGVKTYRIEGPIFFVNADEFNGHFTPHSDPKTVVVDLANSHVLDFSALWTLNLLGKRYANAKRELLIRMMEDDYELYSSISDEKEKRQGSLLRRYLPTRATKAIHGYVSSHKLLPWRYQEFEAPLPMASDGPTPSKDPPGLLGPEGESSGPYHRRLSPNAAHGNGLAEIQASEEAVPSLPNRRGGDVLLGVVPQGSEAGHPAVHGAPQEERPTSTAGAPRRDGQSAAQDWVLEESV